MANIENEVLQQMVYRLAYHLEAVCLDYGIATLPEDAISDYTAKANNQLTVEEIVEWAKRQAYKELGQ